MPSYGYVVNVKANDADGDAPQSTISIMGDILFLLVVIASILVTIFNPGSINIFEFWKWQLPTAQTFFVLWIIKMVFGGLVLYKQPRQTPESLRELPFWGQILFALVGSTVEEILVRWLIPTAVISIGIKIGLSSVVALVVGFTVAGLIAVEQHSHYNPRGMLSVALGVFIYTLLILGWGIPAAIILHITWNLSVVTQHAIINLKNTTG